MKSVYGFGLFRFIVFGLLLISFINCNVMISLFEGMQDEESAIISETPASQVNDPTPSPTVEPGLTPTPTVEPGLTPTPTVEPGLTPTPTVEPGLTPTPTVEPGLTPTPTVESTPTPSPTYMPTPTVVPFPTPESTFPFLPTPTPDRSLANIYFAEDNFRVNRWESFRVNIYVNTCGALLGAYRISITYDARRIVLNPFIEDGGIVFEVSSEEGAVYHKSSFLSVIEATVSDQVGDTSDVHIVSIYMQARETLGNTSLEMHVEYLRDQAGNPIGDPSGDSCRLNVSNRN